MALKKSGGPSSPADLMRKPAAPITNSRKAGGSKKSAEAEDTGECTCGQEIGKQLEALEAGGGGETDSGVGGVLKDKVAGTYRKE